MEYAEGGDLFDKIEADVGLEEDIAHLYFQQLISGVSFMHSKGVAHRDLKPENILLSESGILKIADFGMATMFEYKGARKQSSTMCGSPPYIAPEVLHCAKQRERRAPSSEQTKYSADLVDIWSCGVILFVLLVGNTPWDEPTNGNWEFKEYVRTSGRSTDPLWQRVPSDALSLLRGMMNIEANKRFSFTQIRQHPWYTRHNPLLNAEGMVIDPIALAAQMLARLRIDLRAANVFQPPPASQPEAAPDTDNWSSKYLSATQPETPINDALFDWERPAPRTLGSCAISSTQPVARNDAAAVNLTASVGHRTTTTTISPVIMPPPSTQGRNSNKVPYSSALEALADEPTMSQFSAQPGVPLSLTQHARRFRDIVPSYSLTRFFSHVPPQLLVQMLRDALHQLNVPLPPTSPHTSFDQGEVVQDHIVTLKIKTVDGRRQSLHGDILVDRYHLVHNNTTLSTQYGYGGGMDVDEEEEEQLPELLEVRFVKIKGDPLEWRRFFKKVAVLCRDGIWSNNE